MKKIFSEVIEKIKKSNIYALVYAPLFLALSVLIIPVYIIKITINQPIPFKYTAILMIFMCIIMSFGGFAQIIKKESPGIAGRTIKGPLPIIVGYLWVIIFFSAGMFFLYQAIILWTE